ncbi:MULTISPECIES: magnesium/cobalt transporter CorA [Catenuloplanes]|uniref:Magnesium transport protein CorA n=1 Tax=Catenuloplanes niger TaxID=587534 RepID=A0AAE3ZZ65_9ACTN|nr:magnesium/cobalt transporter CorA [Catenuloplanes niger]MDR7327620.1 magnesium transporter [Catenuloplanes niger]
MHTTEGIVDCALYVGGVRAPGKHDLAALYEQARQTPGAFVWIGLHEPGTALLAEVAGTFALHPLAVEDVVHQEQLPKLERYGDTAFLVLRAAAYVEHTELTESSEIVDTGSVRMFVGPRFVVTVRHGHVGALRQVRDELEATPEQLAEGPWAVAHGVCDRIVDEYVRIAAAMRADVDTVERGVFARDRALRIEHIYQLKRELLEFRSAVLPLQQPLAALQEPQTAELPTEIRRYFRDVRDHHSRVVDQITKYDDLLNSLLQARLAQVTVEQNNDMRKIASWAAIAAMQTAIAGIYGMNFTFMPELKWRYGYPGVLTLMLVGSVFLYRRLRRVGWL